MFLLKLGEIDLTRCFLSERKAEGYEVDAERGRRGNLTVLDLGGGDGEFNAVFFITEKRRGLRSGCVKRSQREFNCVRFGRWESELFLSLLVYIM